jgi:hypothetical protein
MVEGMPLVTTAVFLIVILACNLPVIAQSTPACTPIGGLSHLSGVVEASGAVVGKRFPDVIWTHNDSGTAQLFAFDTRGAVKARVALTGVKVTDWEDVAIGPCPGGSCMYAADIGDNDRRRRSLTIYRFSEPRPGDTGVAVTDTWQLTYPDGPHDAEALFVTPSGEMFIITKEEGDSAGLYRAAVPTDGAAVTLQRVGQLPLRLATGASISADGEWTAVRSNDALLIYRTKELITGKGQPAHRVDLRALREPQGEGVAFGPRGIIYLTGEGPALKGGTLAALKCALN